MDTTLRWCGCDKAPPHMRRKFAERCAHAALDHHRRLGRRVRILSLLSGRLKQDAIMLQRMCSWGRRQSTPIELVMCDLLYGSPETKEALRQQLTRFVEDKASCVDVRLVFIDSLASLISSKRCCFDMVIIVDASNTFDIERASPPGTGNIHSVGRLPVFQLPGSRRWWVTGFRPGREKTRARPKMGTHYSIFLDLSRVIRRSPDATLHILDVIRTYHGPAADAVNLMELVFLKTAPALPIPPLS